MQGEILAHQEEQGIPTKLHDGGRQEVVTSGYGASKDVGSSCTGVAPTERLELRGQKRARPPSLFKEGCGLEVEEELSTMATQTWAKVAWTGKWNTEQKEAWTNQVLEVERQVRGLAGAAMCETRDLGIRWPHRHTSIFEGEVRIDMRYVLPKRREEDALASGQVSFLEEVGSKA